MDYGFLQQQQQPGMGDPSGDLGQGRTFFGGSRLNIGGRFFSNQFFPFRFPFFGFPYAYPYYTPYAYPPYQQQYAPPVAPLSVSVTFDSNTQTVQTTQAGLNQALAMLNASTGPVYVTVVANGLTVLTKSVAAGMADSALQAMRAAGYPTAPSYPQYPQYPQYPGYGYPYGYGNPYGIPSALMPWWRGILFGGPEGELAGVPGELGMPPGAMPYPLPPGPEYAALPPAHYPHPQLPPHPY